MAKNRQNLASRQLFQEKQEQGYNKNLSAVQKKSTARSSAANSSGAAPRGPQKRLPVPFYQTKVFVFFIFSCGLSLFTVSLVLYKQHKNTQSAALAQSDAPEYNAMDLGGLNELAPGESVPVEQIPISKFQQIASYGGTDMSRAILVNPEIPWYQQYFCRGFRSSTGYCSWFAPLHPVVKFWKDSKGFDLVKWAKEQNVALPNSTPTGSYTLEVSPSPVVLTKKDSDDYSVK